MFHEFLILSLLPQDLAMYDDETIAQILQEASPDIMMVPTPRTRAKSEFEQQKKLAKMHKQFAELLQDDAMIRCVRMSDIETHPHLRHPD